MRWPEHPHTAAQTHRPGLRNLLPVALLVLGETEAVRANNGPVLQRHLFTEDTVFSHHRMSVRKQVVSGLHARVEHYVRKQRAMRSQPHSLANDHICSDVRPLADFCGRIDDRRGVNSRCVSWRLVEHCQRP